MTRCGGERGSTSPWCNALVLGEGVEHSVPGHPPERGCSSGLLVNAFSWEAPDAWGKGSVHPSSMLDVADRALLVAPGGSGQAPPHRQTDRQSNVSALCCAVQCFARSVSHCAGIAWSQALSSLSSRAWRAWITPRCCSTATPSCVM
jgi:hypothetical protein